MIYLFLGPEQSQKDDKIAMLKKNCAEKCGDLDFHSLHGLDGETSLASVMAILQSPPLFAGGIFVVVNEAECLKAGKKSSWLQALAEWAKSQTDDVLVLQSTDYSIDKNIEALVPPKCKQTFWEKSETQKEQWLVDFFARQSHKVSKEAVETILEMVGGDTAAMKEAAQRISSAMKENATVEEDDVEKVLFRTKDETPFSLFATMCDAGKSNAERFSQAAGVLQTLQMSKESDSIGIIAGLTFKFRQLRLWHELRASGENDDFTLKKNGFSSKKSREQMSSAQKIWSLPETRAAISQLAAFDAAARRAGEQISKELMALCIYALMFKRTISLF